MYWLTSYTKLVSACSVLSIIHTKGRVAEGGFGEFVGSEVRPGE
jgi:hypothetical protein